MREKGETALRLAMGAAILSWTVVCVYAFLWRPAGDQVIMLLNPPTATATSDGIGAAQASTVTPTQTPLPTPVPVCGYHVAQWVDLEGGLRAVPPMDVRHQLVVDITDVPPLQGKTVCPDDPLLDRAAPYVCYDSQGACFVLAGFEPLEAVQVLRYINRQFAGVAWLKVDENGTGVATSGAFDTDLVVVYGEDGAFVSNRCCIESPFQAPDEGGQGEG